MEMSKEEKAMYMGVMRRRYAAARRKKARGRVLDEFCGMKGLTRKHAIKALSPKKNPSGRRGCPSGGTREGTVLLTRLWKLSDMMCGKLLKAILPELLASLRRRETVPLAKLMGDQIGGLRKWAQGRCRMAAAKPAETGSGRRIAA